MTGRLRALSAILLATVVVAFAIYVVPVIPGVPRTQAELKFSVIDAVGAPMVCTGWGMPNPEFSPDTEYLRIVSDLPTYLAIIRHEHLPPTPLNHDEVVIAYRAWLKLNAVQLQWGDGYYDFRMFPGQSPTERLENDTVGKVDLSGRVYDVREGSDYGACPICLEGRTLIATPSGDVAAANIAVGMHVWSADVAGHRIDSVVIRLVQRIDAPGSTLVHMVLSDRREVTASGPHRLADGRALGSIRVGDVVGDARVVALKVVPDPSGHTYDLLPSGLTGEYWAGGVLLQSTLHA